MSSIADGIAYFLEHLVDAPGSSDSIAELLLQHVVLSGVSLAIALAIGLPIGIYLAGHGRARAPVLAALGGIYTIPSLALFTLLIMVFGIGRVPAVIALVAYAQLVIVRNTMVGLLGVDPAVTEAARGMGLSRTQRLTRVDLPLALPMIVAGTRLAAVTIIGIASVAAFINAGGLGVLLFKGILSGNQSQIIAGSIAITGLAVAVNALLRLVERRSALAAGQPEA